MQCLFSYIQGAALMREREVQRLELRREGDYVGRIRFFGIFNRRSYVLERMRSGYCVWRLSGFEKR